MKTLLTEKQVYRIHKGDNHSARTRMRIGAVFRKKFKFFQCVDKIIFKINLCPHCGKKNTFHKRQQSDSSRQYDNVYRTFVSSSIKSMVFHKLDYCLNCHKEFHIETYCYKRLTLKEYSYFYLLNILKKR